MNKRGFWTKTHIIALLLVVVCTGAIAKAAYTIWSNISNPVTPSQFALTLGTVTMPNDYIITIPGALTKDGAPFASSIKLFTCAQDGSSKSLLVTVPTNGDGTFSFDWNNNTDTHHFYTGITYYFIANYDVS